MSIYFLINI